MSTLHCYLCGIVYYYYYYINVRKAQRHSTTIADDGRRLVSQPMTIIDNEAVRHDRSISERKKSSLALRVQAALDPLSPLVSRAAICTADRQVWE